MWKGKWIAICGLEKHPPTSSAPGILQARILEWVAISFSRDLPDPGIKPVSLEFPALAGKFFTTGTTWEAPTLNEPPNSLSIMHTPFPQTDLTRLWWRAMLTLSLISTSEAEWKCRSCHVWLFVARQALLSMEFSRWEYWSGLPFLSPGDIPNPQIEPGSPALQADSLLSQPQGRGIL